MFFVRIMRFCPCGLGPMLSGRPDARARRPAGAPCPAWRAYGRQLALCLARPALSQLPRISAGSFGMIRWAEYDFRYPTDRHAAGASHTRTDGVGGSGGLLGVRA